VLPGHGHCVVINTVLHAVCKRHVSASLISPSLGPYTYSSREHDTACVTFVLCCTVLRRKVTCRDPVALSAGLQYAARSLVSVHIAMNVHTVSCGVRVM
jgi:hypothetical protein